MNFGTASRLFEGRLDFGLICYYHGFMDVSHRFLDPHSLVSRWSSGLIPRGVRRLCLCVLLFDRQLSQLAVQCAVIFSDLCDSGRI